MRLGARREARGAEVAGVVAEVLRLVVVEHSRGLDTDRGQRLILEDRDGVLRARNPGFREHQRLQFRGHGVGGGQVRGTLDLRHADGGALGGRLHDQRELEALERVLEILLPAQHHEVRARDAHGKREALGAQLVHADGRAHDAAAGIRDTEVLERALQRPVFAPRSMQRDPHAREALRGQLVQRPIARVEGLRVHAAAPQALQHRVAGEERDLALAGIAPVEHRHASELARCGDAALGSRVVDEAHGFTALPRSAPRE